MINLKLDVGQLLKIYQKWKIMSEDIKQIVMDAKYARIIEALSEMYNMTLEKATDIFYNS